MSRYRIAGLTLVTELEFPELPEASGEERPWSVEQVRESLPEAGEVLREESIDQRVWMRIIRAGEGYRISFPEAAEFEVSPAKRAVAFHAKDVGPSTLRHLLLDLVVPYLLTLDGSLVLHASAVATEPGVVVFAGASGCGKSSLAAEFAREGCPVVADDFVLLQETEAGFAVVPAYPGLRLWPDSAEALTDEDSSLTPVYDGGTKQRVVAPSRQSVSSQERPLAGIVLLDGEPHHGTDPALDPVTPREAMMSLFGQAFRMERASRKRAVHEFDQFARLANSTRLFRLRFRRHYSELPRVRKMLLAELEQ